MKEIPLSQGKVTLVDDDDYEELNRHKWFAQKSRATCYAARNSFAQNGKRIAIYMHRELVKPTLGTKTDHRDGNGLNNQVKNLRIASPAQNAYNRAKQKGATSAFKGVSWNRRHAKWRATITVQDKQIHLGYFDSEIQAARKYDIAAQKYFGEFARLNFSQI